MTWLGIDLGDARVGLAMSDPELTLAHPIGNVQVYGDSFRALDDVIDIIEDEHIDRVIVGLPLQLDGTEGKSAKKARRWASNLAKRIGRLMEDGEIELDSAPEIELQDERLTTVSAHRQLYDANVAGRKHRPVVDQQSAVVILQSALDRNEH
ncbi:Holliday junction resolvase RuvX [Bifidobacterium sp. MA2]|uniref:Putative pre-16S rRNA nuclease n=1 Tax=Bifidobacterium santillanense TaxID=2809028 RepID=A0ABS5ULV1_9BIFI|nr:Holliday junction resolvase RuvX [Bifidobacterium santillanense]MBT1171886.1 Holliday junction resolvase RuvX [Bifidobacterium santillanense]